jgi:hypothetical protein
MKPKNFGLLLKIAGFKPSKSGAIRLWDGLRLKTDTERVDVAIPLESQLAASPASAVLQ